MSAQTKIDDRTAEVIRSAIAAAQAGRIEEACEIGHRGLADGADSVALHALIGALLSSVGEFERATPHLKMAFDARPTDPVILRNLATAMTASERYAELLPILSDEVVASDPGQGLRNRRGFAAQMTGDFAAAIADFETVVAGDARDWETWNNLGNARVNAGDLEGGSQALRRASELNPRAAPTRLNLARALRDSGDFPAAETELRAMAADFPDDANPLADLYHVLRALGRDESETEGVLEQAANRDPQNVELLLELGGQQQRTFSFTGAERTYRAILALQPSNGQAFFGLAQVLEHLQPSGLEDLAAQAEAANIDDDRLNLIRAFAARRSKNYREGLQTLGRIPDDLESATRWHLAGQMHDALGEYDLALDAFTRMNQAQGRHESEPLRRAAELRHALRDELQRTTAEWKDSWAAPALTAERPAPIFLAGFPRSGTTLLDTMLMGHPNVEVMEEPPILRQLEIEFGSFEVLATMDEDRVRQAQRRYFKLAANHAELRDGSLLIDKSPLYLQRVPQILRLFPDARFILALRHPADAVLSCFISNFRLNNSMANFLQLDTAAEFYDLSFAMWERALAVFGMPVHTVVYERMIEDPEAALRPVVEGLGLEWKPEIVNHQSTAEARGLITTASYAQVTRPLYRGSVGRWQHYRKHLEPVLPALRPWAQKFGYEI